MFLYKVYNLVQAHSAFPFLGKSELLLYPFTLLDPASLLGVGADGHTWQP